MIYKNNEAIYKGNISLYFEGLYEFENEYEEETEEKGVLNSIWVEEFSKHRELFLLINKNKELKLKIKYEFKVNLKTVSFSISFYDSKEKTSLLSANGTYKCGDLYKNANIIKFKNICGLKESSFIKNRLIDFVFSVYNDIRYGQN